MYTFIEQTSEIELLNRECKRIISLLFDAMTPAESRLRLPADNALFSSDRPGRDFYVLREGSLAYTREGRQLFFLEEGDLVGVENHFGIGSGVVHSDFAVILDRYSSEDFFALVQSNKEVARLWNHYLAAQITLLKTLLSGMNTCELALYPEVKGFAPGEMIVEEGAPSDEVLTLVEGSAALMQGGSQIGEIIENEIFGALGVLTGTPRAASVVATTPCTIISLRPEQFFDLFQTRPATIKTMVTTMASTILHIAEGRENSLKLV